MKSLVHNIIVVTSSAPTDTAVVLLLVANFYPNKSSPGGVVAVSPSLNFIGNDPNIPLT